MELATICSFTRMAKLLKIATNQKAEEIPNHIIAQVGTANDMLPLLRTLG